MRMNMAVRWDVAPLSLEEAYCLRHYEYQPVTYEANGEVLCSGRLYCIKMWEEWGEESGMRICTSI